MRTGDPEMAREINNTVILHLLRVNKSLSCVDIARRLKLSKMDEPMAALGVREARKVLDLIEEIRKHVNGIIVITHNIEQIIKIADRVIVLRNGKRVGDIDSKEYVDRLDDLHNDIVKLITGAEIIDYTA